MNMIEGCRQRCVCVGCIYPSLRRHHGRFATHTLSYTFFEKQIFKIFWGTFPGPQGLLHLIFEFPYSRYKPPIFSEVSTPFSWSYSGAPDVSTYFTSIRRHLPTHTLSYTFSKNQIFKNFLGPFPEPPGLDARIFGFHSPHHLP